MTWDAAFVGKNESWEMCRMFYGVLSMPTPSSVFHFPFPSYPLTRLIRPPNCHGHGQPFSAESRAATAFSRCSVFGF